MKCRINNNLIDFFVIFISAVLIVCSVLFIIFLIGYVFVHLGVQPIHIASSAFDYYLYTGWSIFVLTIFPIWAIYWIYILIKTIYKTPSKIYSWLIKCD